MPYLLIAVFAPSVSLICCILPFRLVISKNRRYFTLLAVLTLLFLSRFVIGHATIIQMDANILQIPFLMSYRDSILSFLQLPLWNPYLWSGMANLAHPLSHTFHPTVFLSLLLPAHKAFNLSLLLAFFFSSSFMFLLMRELGQDNGVALISSVVYAFNEFTLDRLGSPSGPGIEYLYSYSIVPLSLALLLRAFKTRRYFYAILSGLSLAFVMNGNPNLLYYTILLCLVLLAYVVVTSPLRSGIRFKIAALLIGLVVLVLVNSIELIPFFEFQQLSSGQRLHLAPGGWRMEGIAWTQLSGLFLPHMKRLHFGYASRVGWIALILALLSLARLRRNEDRRTVILMLVLLGFGILLLTHSPLFAVMSDYVPFFSRISMIPAVFVFLIMPLSALSGIGSKTLARKPGIQILLALFIFSEIVASSNGWFRYSQLPRIDSFDYVREMGDFPHLASLNEERTLKPYRIECRAPGYRVLCPDYAIMYYRLRLVNGGIYLFPTEQIKEVLEREQKTKLLDVKYILSLEELEEPGFALREKVRWQTFDEHKESGFHQHLRKLTKEGGEWDGTIYVYQASRNGHAFLVDDGFTGEELPDDPTLFDVTYFSPMRIELEGYAPRSDILFVSELYYPGWKATVDGANVDVRNLGDGFLGVPLDEGSHSIILYYAPFSFKLGFWHPSQLKHW
jgi:hypothetical protein